MNDPDYDIELIERYFDQDLTSDEKALFERRLRQDPGFKSLFDQERHLIGAIRFEGALTDLEYLQATEAGLSKKERGASMMLWYYVAAAACLGIFALVVWRPLQKSNHEDLFAANFSPHPNVFEPTVRGGAGSDLAAAYQSYENGDYEKALTLFAATPSERREPGMQLLLGNCYLVVGRTADAQEVFQDIIDKYDELDAEARWYLGLAHLKENDVQQARQYFVQVAESNNVFSAKASALLEKIK